MNHFFSHSHLTAVLNTFYHAFSHKPSPMMRFVAYPERSTTTLGRNIDRTERNTEPTEPKNSENLRFGILAFFRPPSVVQS